MGDLPFPGKSTPALNLNALIVCYESAAYRASFHADRTKAPLIAENVANIECRVIHHVAEHDLFILQGMRA